jgi:TetR/AcrR family transcriptional regulator, transcriptional repressor for nem operon
MPWPEDHKQQTRDRIVDAAASALRANGIDGVSIAEIMAEAGLTHGGFYAHFASKDELLSAAIARASHQTIDRLANAMRSMPPERRIDAVIDAYLSAKHADHPEQGCALAALGPELTRVGGQVQRDLAGSLQRRLEWLRALLPEDKASEDTAIAVHACLLGGLIMARAVGPEKSAAVLAATRAFVHDALEG